MGLKRANQSDTDRSESADKNEARIKREAEEKRRQARTLAKQQQAAERIASSSIELSTGVSDAANSRDALYTAMKEISIGADESSHATQISLSSTVDINKKINRQREIADITLDKTASQKILIEKVSEDIFFLVESISNGSKRQQDSVKVVGELGEQATKINDAVKQVMRIADQTNLLALNAAIEAGRAGRHGRGFAVVADTVRTLAEASEHNAVDIGRQIETIQSRSTAIITSVRKLAEVAEDEVRKGKSVTQKLGQIREEMNNVTTNGELLGAAAKRMSVASDQMQAGSQTIAASAEQQTAACQDVLKTLEQQGGALTGAEQAAQGLEVITEDLKNSTDIIKSSEEVAATAEELSASVEEINRSSTQIMSAVAQIANGAEESSSAVEQAVSGMTQIEKDVVCANDVSKKSLEQVGTISALLKSNKDSVYQMICGINKSLETSEINLTEIEEVEKLAMGIDKVSEGISVVSIKTAMLAVNGAVEAARAGEHGKGFAVVSGDIQNLADDAAENVELIKDLVKAIQAQTTKVRAELSDIARAYALEVTNAKKATEEFERIVENMDQVVSGNEELTQVIVHIVESINGAKKGMESIAAANEQASSNAQEAARSSEQQAQSTEALAASIEAIASVADELQSG